MPRSDTPASDRLLRGPQGPADWSRETPSDDLFGDEARRRLGLPLIRLLRRRFRQALEERE